MLKLFLQLETSVAYLYMIKGKATAQVRGLIVHLICMMHL